MNFLFRYYIEYSRPWISRNTTRINYDDNDKVVSAVRRYPTMDVMMCWLQCNVWIMLRWGVWMSGLNCRNNPLAFHFPHWCKQRLWRALILAREGYHTGRKNGKCAQSCESSLEVSQHLKSLSSDQAGHLTSPNTFLEWGQIGQIDWERTFLIQKCFLAYTHAINKCQNICHSQKCWSLTFMA